MTSRRNLFIVGLVSLLGLGALAVSDFDFNEIFYGLGAERPPPSVDITNPTEFSLIPFNGGASVPFEEDVESDAARGLPKALVLANATRENRPFVFRNMIGDLACSGPDDVIRFARIVDETGLEFDDRFVTVENYRPENFEVFFTLGPGYCFERLTGDSYTLSLIHI